MEVLQFVYDVSALEHVFNGIEPRLEQIGKLGPGVLSGLGFDLAVGPEDLPAGLTLDDGVVGWVVLRDEGGATTFEALKVDDNSVVGHGPPLSAPVT
jgi:hypothetical protein